MSELPKGWVWATIGDLGAYINGFAFKPTDRSETGLPIIRIQNLTDPDRPLHRTARPVPEEYRVQTGDILVSWSATLDAFRWGRGEALVNQHIFKVVPNVAVAHAPWLLYWLKVAIEQMQETEHLHGSTMKHINRGPFLAHPIPLPPLGAQVRIAEALDELLIDLNAGVAELKAAQAKLQRYRQSLLKAAVQGDLTADWRAANTPAETGAEWLQRILAERRARWEAAQRAKAEAAGKALAKGWQSKYAEPAEAGTTGLYTLPEGWVWASLDQLTESLRSGTAETSGREPTPHAVLKSSAVRPGSIDFGACNYLRPDQARPENELQLGDLLITRLSGSVEYVGCCAVVRQLPPGGMQHPDRIFCAKLLPSTRPAADTLVAFLAAGYARQRIEEAAKSTAGHKRISQSDLLPFPIPLPPLAEQARIAELAAEALAAADAMQSAIDKSLAQCAAQRQNILRAAFAGQLVPQDSTDEPAEAMLARIRASHDGAKPPARKRAARTPAGA